MSVDGEEAPPNVAELCRPDEGPRGPNEGPQGTDKGPTGPEGVSTVTSSARWGFNPDERESRGVCPPEAAPLVQMMGPCCGVTAGPAACLFLFFGDKSPPFVQIETGPLWGVTAGDEVLLSFGDDVFFREAVLFVQMGPLWGSAAGGEGLLSFGEEVPATVAPLSVRVVRDDGSVAGMWCSFRSVDLASLTAVGNESLESALPLAWGGSARRTVYPSSESLKK